jgi:diguanylate cyclase (GGDEF)-like protein
MDKILLESVVGKYPSSFFLVKPIIHNNRCDDFTYVYANPAFGLFVGRDVSELVDHTFSEVFGIKGEAFWLNLFYETVSRKMVRYVNNTTTVLQRYLSLESFYVEPDMCGCIIRDYNPAMADHDVCYCDSLQNKAYIDALTGTYNRFHLQEHDNLFSDQDNIGVAFFDLNRLKETNDKYGHSAGDKLLCDFAQLLNTYYNKAPVYRLGGDEFLVLTREMPENIFNACCHSVKGALDVSGDAAIGFKFYPHTGNIWDAIDECDKLMYEHKAAMKKSL